MGGKPESKYIHFMNPFSHVYHIIFYSRMSSFERMAPLRSPLPKL